jgi:hypothetical protein
MAETMIFAPLTDDEVDQIEQFYRSKREGEREDALALCANIRYARDQVDVSREKVATFMLHHGYATGHGDTIDDLLLELGGGIKTQIERWRHIVMDILQADEGGQGLPYAEAMARANAALKE